MPPTTEEDARIFGPFASFVLSILIGIFAGLGAGGFRALIALCHNLALAGRFSFSYDANVFTSASPWGDLVFLPPVVGAFFVAFLVKNFAPEAKGHGVPEVIDAIYFGRDLIRPVVVVVKAVASAITIGTGGSVGREGPIIQIGSAFGSTVGRALRLPEWQRTVLISAGAGAGIAATFNTPIGGVLFATELIMDRVSVRTLVPVVISTAVSSYVGRVLFGPFPAFVIPTFQAHGFHRTVLIAFLACMPLGALCGLASALFIRSIYAFEDFFEERIGGSYYRKHALGMLAVGILILLTFRLTGHYHVEGVGYSTIQDILVGSRYSALLLAALFGAKLLATALTLGSGGSGGIFSPSLFLGATLGSLYGAFVMAIFPHIGIRPEQLAIIGMASLVGGSTGAAVTAIVMVFEMTLNYGVIVPMTLAVAISFGVRTLLVPESIYTLKLARRGHVVPRALIRGPDRYPE